METAEQPTASYLTQRYREDAAFREKTKAYQRRQYWEKGQREKRLSKYAEKKRNLNQGAVDPAV